MAAKQTQLTKRQIPDRSVMLTRFKLSQQKRQLREKERKTSESKSSPGQKSTEDKKLKSKTTPCKNKKEKEEFHPSKLKRKIASKKIILKSRHELKVIGGGKGCKRKLNLSQKGLKSPPAKRTKPCNDFNSGPPESDRSQSPIYSELGFEEIIRMVDENQSLDDDDLLEILTCPSPVWWEDPPDDGYMEGPIILTQNSPKTTSLPTLAKQFRSKTSRKTTPHKLILEPSESTNDNKGDKQDIGNILDSSTLQNIKKTDDKFRNKRSKLESLLSVIKNKIDESKCQSNNINKKEDSKENRKDMNDISELQSTHNKTVPNRSKKESETELDDITFANISQQDKDSLKDLENIKIPIEGKSKGFDNNTQDKPSFDFRKKSINPNDMFKVIKKSKNITSFVNNKILKILKIKKMVVNPLAQKNLAQINFFPAKSILKEQSDSKEKSQSDKKINVTEQNDVNSVRNISLCNDIEDKVIESKIDCQNLSVSVDEKINDKNVPTKENPNSEDFVTIFKIVVNTNDKKENQTNEHLEEVKEEIKTENEITDKESKTLDSYYKKCKGRRRDFTKVNSKEDLKKEVENEVFLDEEEELCDSCDKKSIIVPSTTDVKYCLKCSSIFDLDECDYCIRKAKFLEKSDSNESVNEFRTSSNTNNLQEYKNNLGDTSCA